MLDSDNLGDYLYTLDLVNTTQAVVVRFMPD